MTKVINAQASYCPILLCTSISQATQFSIIECSITPWDGLMCYKNVQVTVTVVSTLSLIVFMCTLSSILLFMKCVLISRMGRARCISPWSIPYLFESIHGR